jgi:hypothetical protein
VLTVAKYKHQLIYLAGVVALSGLQPALAEETAKKEGDSKLSPCAVKLVDPTHCTPDCEKVIDVVRSITRALADHDFETMATYMDENCSCYDEHTGKLVTGRNNIIADVRTNVTAEEKRLKVPAIAFTIDHPYAKITGDTATVNFVLVKEVGGEHPARYQSHCTDVLVKRDGQWKKLLFRGDDFKLVK